MQDFPRLGVKRRERLVHQQDRRIDRKRAHEADALLHAARQLIGVVLLKAGEPATTELISVGTDGNPSITVWTYIRTGYDEAIANLTFSGNKLIKIELNLLKP